MSLKFVQLFKWDQLHLITVENGNETIEIIPCHIAFIFSIQVFFHFTFTSHKITREHIASDRNRTRQPWFPTARRSTLSYLHLNAYNQQTKRLKQNKTKKTKTKTKQKTIQKKQKQNISFWVQGKCYITCNSFMTEVLIIKKPVHGMQSKSMDWFL